MNIAQVVSLGLRRISGLQDQFTSSDVAGSTFIQVIILNTRFAILLPLLLLANFNHSSHTNKVMLSHIISVQNVRIKVVKGGAGLSSILLYIRFQYAIHIKGQTIGNERHEI